MLTDEPIITPRDDITTQDDIIRDEPMPGKPLIIDIKITADIILILDPDTQDPIQETEAMLLAIGENTLTYTTELEPVTTQLLETAELQAHTTEL